MSQVTPNSGSIHWIEDKRQRQDTRGLRGVLRQILVKGDDYDLPRMLEVAIHYNSAMAHGKVDTWRNVNDALGIRMHPYLLAQELIDLLGVLDRQVYGPDCRGGHCNPDLRTWPQESDFSEGSEREYQRARLFDNLDDLYARYIQLGEAYVAHCLEQKRAREFRDQAVMLGACARLHQVLGVPSEEEKRRAEELAVPPSPSSSDDLDDADDRAPVSPLHPEGAKQRDDRDYDSEETLSDDDVDSQATRSVGAPSPAPPNTPRNNGGAARPPSPNPAEPNGPVKLYLPGGPIWAMRTTHDGVTKWVDQQGRTVVPPNTPVRGPQQVNVLSILLGAPRKQPAPPQPAQQGPVPPVRRLDFGEFPEDGAQPGDGPMSPLRLPK